MNRRLGWSAWQMPVRHDPYGREIFLSIDMTTPPELISPVFLRVGKRAKPIALDQQQVMSLIDALWAAKRAAVGDKP